MSRSFFFIVLALVLFLIALLVPLWGTLDPDAERALLFGGLASFAAGHLP